MGAFTCPRCNAYCCTCSGCHPQTAADGTQGCTRCIPSYEHYKTQSQRVIKRPSVSGYGKPQITYKRY